MEDHGEETDNSANEDRHNVPDGHNLPPFQALIQGGHRIPEHKQQDGKGQYPQEEFNRFAQDMGGQTFIETESFKHQQRVDRYSHPGNDRYQHQRMEQPFHQGMGQSVERNYYSSNDTNSTHKAIRDERSNEHDSLVSRESIPSKYMVKVTGVTRTNEELLDLYFTNERRSGAVAEKIEFNHHLESLILTYSSLEDMESVLCKEHIVGGCKLILQHVNHQTTTNTPTTTVVKISGIKHINRDSLTYYVENKKRFGAEIVSLNFDEEDAFVTLALKEDMESVLCKDHTVGGCKLILQHVNHQTTTNTPKTTVVKISGIKHINRDSLTYYVENKKRFGAEIVSLNFDEEDAFVTLPSKEDAETVCKENHKVSGEELEICIYTPPPVLTDRFLITNIDNNTSNDTLVNFIEGNLNCEVLNTEFHTNKDKAVVYCKEEEYEEAFERSIILKRKQLSGRNLEIRAVNESKIARISGDLAKLDPELLKLYFENNRRSGGGCVEKVELFKDSDYALVYFENYSDLKNVCKKEKHELSNQSLEAAVYYQFLYGVKHTEDANTTDNKILELNDIEQKKLEYIHQNPEVYSEFQQQMQSVCCMIDWNKEEKKVSINPTEKREIGGKRQIEHCVELVKNYLNNLFFHECSMPTEIVSMVLEKMNKDERRVLLSGEESSIIVIGSDPGFCRQIVSTINEIETELKEQMQKDKKDITEIASFKYSYDIIHTFGILENVMEAFRITVSQHTNSGNIELKGRYADVERAKLKIGQMLDDLTQTTLNLHPCKIDFILGREFKDYVVKKYFNGKTDMASWERTNEDTVKIVTKDSEELQTIAGLFKGIVYEEIQIDEVGDIFLTEKWRKFQSVIESRFQNLANVKVRKPNHISITCLAPNKAEISECVDCFVAENIVCSDSLTVKDEYDNFIVKYRFPDLKSWCRDIQVSIRFDQASNSINIKGSRRGIQQTKDTLENMRGDVYCREDLIQEPTNKKFLKSEKGLEALEMIQKTRSCIITTQSEETKDMSQDIELAAFTFRNTTVKVVLGDITDLLVDIIVNACNEDLSHSAGLAKAIVQKGGSSIQDECKEYSKKNGKLYPGGCMVSKSGTLPCKHVIHAFGPKWKGGNKNEAKILREAILRILELVAEYGYKTVAIPAISCGIYGYPVLKATRVIVNGIVDHFKNMSNSPITAIYLVDLQQEITKSFISSLKEKKDHFKQQIPTKTQNMKNEGDVKLNAAAAVKQGILWPTLLIGEIARVSADVIVNSTSEALNLRDGAVSGSILKTGGDVLQTECKTNYPDGINPGDIAVTNGGNLKCKNVFHICLNPYQKGQELSLEKLIKKCLKQAESMGHKSIAFPALGTGNLNYPAEIAARSFFDTVSKYGKKRGKIDVTIVLYSGDVKTVKTFGEAEKQSRPQSHGQPDVKHKINSNQKTDTLIPHTLIPHQSAVDEMKKGINIGVFNVKVTESNIMETKTHMIIVEYKKVLKQKDQKNASDEITIESLEATDLHIKYIIYVDHERYKRNFREAITKCLEIADGKGFTSMAFQIPGEDKSNLEIEKIAKSFYEAMKKSKKWKKLRNIEIFINDQATINPFCKELKKFTLPKQSFKNKISRIVGSNDKTDGAMQTKNKDNEGTEDDDEVDDDWPVIRDGLVNEEITLYFYSDDREEISKAMEELDYKYLREIHQSEISYTGLSLTGKEMTSIYKLAEEHCVQFKFDHHLYRIIVRGLNTDTNIVHEGIQRILREFEVSNLLKVVIQWSWLEKGKKNNFSTATNKNIEDSFQSKQDTMDFELHRTTMTIRFDEMIMVAENKGEYPVIRQDKVKESTIQLPLNWNLTDGTNLNVVTLDKLCDEYQEVVKNFQATLGTTTADIVKIERIENRSVYQQYMAKKKQMELEIPGKNVEQPVLWHGTDKDAISSINNYGFNRSYCGKNAFKYGQGVYFAVNSYYSTRYAKRNTEGGRQMYQCRVLVGESTEGKQEYRVPPKKPDGHVYESLVNDINDPEMFIIFHDTQAYPNYLITF